MGTGLGRESMPDTLHTSESSLEAAALFWTCMHHTGHVFIVVKVFQDNYMCFLSFYMGIVITRLASPTNTYCCKISVRYDTYHNVSQTHALTRIGSRHRYTMTHLILLSFLVLLTLL